MTPSSRSIIGAIDVRAAYRIAMQQESLFFSSFLSTLKMGRKCRRFLRLLYTFSTAAAAALLL